MGLLSSWFGVPGGNSFSSSSQGTNGTGVGSPTPGQSRGLFRWVRDKFGGWPGPRAAAEAPIGRWVQEERVRGGPQGIALPAFLPYYDDKTGETAAARNAYRRMLADPNCKSAVLSVIYGVSSLGLQIHPANKKVSRDQDVAELVHWNLTRRLHEGFPGLVESALLPALIDGYSVSAKVIARQQRGKYEGAYVLDRLKVQDTGNDLVLQVDEFKNVTGLLGLRYNAGIEFSPAQFLIYRHNPLYNSPTGTSAFRAVYSRYWALDTVLKLRAIAAEKRAIPFLLGKFTNPTLQSTMDNVLASAKSLNYASVPAEQTIEVIEMAGAADQIFKSFCDDLREEIFLGIQNATLQSLTGGQGEHRGSSSVHKSTADMVRWRLASAIEQLLNDEVVGLIRDIVDLNHVVDEYPYATLSAVDPNDLRAELEIDRVLVEMGVPLSLEDTYERYGRVPPKAADDVLKKSAANPPGAEDSGGDGPGGSSIPPNPPGLQPGPKGEDGLGQDALPFAEGDWEESKHPRDDSGKFGHGSGSGSADKIGSGSSGDVVRIGDEAVKSAVRKDGSKTLEGNVYKDVGGANAISQGREQDGKIHTPIYKHVLSVDDVPEKQRRNLAPIVRNNKERINEAVSALSAAGYSYNDPLQFGLDAEKKAHLFDFSNVEKAGKDQALDDNMALLATFYEQFGMPDESKNVRSVNEVLRGVKSILADGPEMAEWLDGDIALLVLKLAENLDGKAPVAAYYATNGRHVGLPNLAQTEPVNGIKVILSDMPLSLEAIRQWELTPVVHVFPESKK